MTEDVGREERIADVIERELAMFLNTKNMGGPASCQENPDMFRKWRWMIFSVLSDEYIASYRDDLIEAERTGRNLMMEKYARMDNLIPCVSPNIDKVRKITVTERVWMEQLLKEFPLLFPQSLARFDMYFPAEMETVSERSLDLYQACIDAALQRGENLARKRYANFYEKMGMGTLEELEARRREKLQ
ncbi:DUF4125 family protein [Halodesulfovibrio spirochaetisodalis]|uniref:DUF4125 family protein n=1 Tax=Halodesulfovibrio spirochaetisodalis TaxID=1560234 RepID=UPI000A62B8DE|nr:DUF4125 family protein [Halodesulfovibrio spirochaetisodalis]